MTLLYSLVNVLTPMLEFLKALPSGLKFTPHCLHRQHGWRELRLKRSNAKPQLLQRPHGNDPPQPQQSPAPQTPRGSNWKKRLRLRPLHPSSLPLTSPPFLPPLSPILLLPTCKQSLNQLWIRWFKHMLRREPVPQLLL